MNIGIEVSEDVMRELDTIASMPDPEEVNNSEFPENKE